MGKISKIDKQKRVQQVLRLLTAFADPSEIRRLAEAQGWDLSDRQLRRYVSAARKQFEQAATRNRRQAFGRHLKQLEAQGQLAMKNGNQLVVLRVLHDLAKIQGLYPRTRGTSRASEEDPLKAPARSSSVLRSVRLARLLAAQSRGDADESQLLLEAAPLQFFRIPDTTLAILQLHILEKLHFAEQIEQLGVLLLAITNLEHEPQCVLIAQLAAYRLKAAEEGWREFIRSQGLAELSTIGNATANWWEQWRERILAIAPSRQDAVAAVRSSGLPAPRLVRAEDFAKRWRAAYALVQAS